jgi:hypothetical protein
MDIPQAFGDLIEWGWHFFFEGLLERRFHLWSGPPRVNGFAEVREHPEQRACGGIPETLADLIQ